MRYSPERVNRYPVHRADRRRRAVSARKRPDAGCRRRPQRSPGRVVRAAGRTLPLPGFADWTNWPHRSTAPHPGQAGHRHRRRRNRRRRSTRSRPTTAWILRGVEISLPPQAPADAARRAVAALDAALGGPDDDEPAYVEPARAAGWRDALEVIAESGYRAKLRTGGTTADACPERGRDCRVRPYLSRSGHPVQVHGRPASRRPAHRARRLGATWVPEHPGRCCHLLGRR